MIIPLWRKALWNETKLNGPRIVRAEEKLIAFLELESAVAALAAGPEIGFSSIEYMSARFGAYVVAVLLAASVSS
jgi:hypothetical protein